jgi:hypothetical protein
MHRMESRQFTSTLRLSDRTDRKPGRPPVGEIAKTGRPRHVSAIKTSVEYRDGFRRLPHFIHLSDDQNRSVVACKPSPKHLELTQYQRLGQTCHVCGQGTAGSRTHSPDSRVLQRSKLHTLARRAKLSEFRLPTFLLCDGEGSPRHCFGPKPPPTKNRRRRHCQ